MRTKTGGGSEERIRLIAYCPMASGSDPPFRPEFPHLEDDLSYFARRLSHEMVAASQAQHPNARRAHVEMAKQYEDRVRALASRTQTSLRLVG